MSRLLLHKKCGKGKLLGVFISAGFCIGGAALIRNFKAPIFLHNIREEIAIKNQHMSSLEYLLDKDGGGKEKIPFLQKIKLIAVELLKTPVYSVQELISPRLSKQRIIRLTIPYESEEILHHDRIQAIRSGYLSNARFTKAYMSSGEDQLDVRIRLKGDLPLHWLAEKRTSFRIKVKGNQYKTGKIINFPYKEFSIHKPRERQYPYEYLFSDSLKVLGLPHVKHEIVKVIVNNQDWGYMDLQEHFDSYSLERQQLKDSLIIRFGDELYWKEYGKNVEEQLNPNQFWLSHPRLFSSINNPKKSKLTEVQQKQIAYINKSLLEPKYQENYLTFLK